MITINKTKLFLNNKTKVVIIKKIFVKLILIKKLKQNKMKLICELLWLFKLRYSITVLCHHFLMYYDL